MAVVTNSDGTQTIRIGGEPYSRADLFHVKAFPWPGSLLGLSPIAYAREAIGLGLGAEKDGAAYFGDAMVPSAVLESDQDIKRESAQRLKAEYVELLRRRRRDIAVLGSGAKLRAIAIAPDEAQFIQTQKFNVSTICRFYGVPPEMMGGETAGHEAYTSPEMRGTDFLTFTLRPWLLRVERAVSGLLPSTQRAKFNAGGFLRATLKEQYEALAIGVGAGIVMPNEARRKLDLPAIPGLDQPSAPPEGTVA